jgi:hypothetical protein
MPKKILVICLLALFVPRPSPADDLSDAMAACDTRPDIPVTVTPRFDEPTYDYSKNIGDIMARASDTHHSIRESLTLGLTQYEPMLSIRAPLITVQSSNGLACAHIEHVDVTVGYQNVVVFIANEIPEGSCGFNEVMAHEQKHINVNRQILEKYTPRIESELGDYVKSNGYFQETDPDYAVKLLKEKFQDIIESIMKDMTAENHERQQAVDSPAEYARISRSCNGQLQGIAARFRQNRQ